jgi:2-iminobutanoate/2-iminopropanoate deaminase
LPSDSIKERIDTEMSDRDRGYAKVIDQPPQREVISTEKAPAAVGPYSQGIRAGHFVFTAGQLGIDPNTGKLVEGGVQAQARQALTNLREVLEAANSSLDRAVKVTVFLKDINDFKAVNEVYAQFFTQDPPARSAVQVAALPLGGMIEIEAVAIR